VKPLDPNDFYKSDFEALDSVMKKRNSALEEGHYGMFLRVIEEQLTRIYPEKSLEIQRASLNGDFLEKYRDILAHHSLLPKDEELLKGLKKSGEIRGWSIDVPYTSTGQFYRQWCNRTFGDLILPETVVLVRYDLSEIIKNLPTLLMEVIEGKFDQNTYRELIEAFGLNRYHHDIRNKIERKIDNDNIIWRLRNMDIPSYGNSNFFLPKHENPSIQLGVAKITSSYKGRKFCIDCDDIINVDGIQTVISEPVPYQYIGEDLKDYVNRIFIDSLTSQIKQIE
jgi:hypothetical protein